MQRPTSVIMTIMAAASGSSTQPMRSAWSPKVNQVKLWMARKPGRYSVGRNAVIANTNAKIWPIIARAAAVRRRELTKLRIMKEAPNGTAGINQRLVTIHELIGGNGANAERRTPNAEHRMGRSF